MALLFATLAFSGIVFTHLPLTVTVVGLAPLSIGIVKPAIAVTAVGADTEIGRATP